MTLIEDCKSEAIEQVNFRHLTDRSNASTVVPDNPASGQLTRLINQSTSNCYDLNN